MLSARKLLLWALAGMVAVAALWVAQVEITYRHNVNHLPAAFHYQRHASIQLWSA
jgi:hypothetical protein